MTNGLAYVYDSAGEFDGHINGESVLVERGLGHEDSSRMRELVERHVALTASVYAQALLDAWDDTVSNTWKVIPRATLLLAVTTPEEVEAKGAAD
jgi:glutamate synthase domain-containing protein 3